MASDEKILQLKDLKNYNSRVKQYVDENAGSGGSTTLADLGITVTAAQINDLTNISKYTYDMANELYHPYLNNKSLVKYVDNSVSFSSLSDTGVKSVNTYLSSYSYKIIGGILIVPYGYNETPIALCYGIDYNNYYNAYFRLYHNTTGGSAISATLRTLYTS